jgi:hypothetical protein
MTQETYREQLIRLVRSLVKPNNEMAVRGDLAQACTAQQVKMFVDGNLEKRLEKLQKQLEFVAEAFDDFDELIVSYVSDMPSASYDSVTSDGDRMLDWLSETKSPTPEQQDYIACQRARHAIEDLARRNRLKHVRFQELRSMNEQSLAELETNHQLRAYLNPIRTWARFVTTALLDDDSQPPANVLVFANGNEISTAVLELEGQALINELADYSPCTLGEWAALSQLADRDELVDLCRDLVDMGLIAFG